MNGPDTYDVIVIGGSYAGLSASLALGRSLRKVLIIDSGKPCNATTPHSQNFLTHDGHTPSAIAAEAKKELAAYKTVELVDDLAETGRKVDDRFEISLRSGRTVQANKVIFATGIRDILPDIPGFSECWGISVIHCPYCHGYEYRGKVTAALANGETAMHYAMLVGNLTNELTILTSGKADFTAEQAEKLARHNIPVIETQVAAVRHRDGYMTSVVLKDGSELPFTALYYKPSFTHHCEIARELGCALTEQGHLVVDSMQKTSVDGVFACGDNSSMMRSVANAVATGNMAGAAVNRELAAERF